MEEVLHCIFISLQTSNNVMIFINIMSKQSLLKSKLEIINRLLLVSLSTSG